MFRWLGDFFENLAHNAPNIPRPFDGFWKAIGRDDGPSDDQEPSSDPAP
jgi:hypothetical protein